MNLLKEDGSKVVLVEVPEGFYKDWYKDLRRMKYVENERNWNTGKASGPRMQIDALSDVLCAFSTVDGGEISYPGQLREPGMVDVFAGDLEDARARQVRMKIYDCIDEAFCSVTDFEESLVIRRRFRALRRILRGRIFSGLRNGQLISPLRSLLGQSFLLICYQ